jgi:hypothetical protein
VGRSVSTIFLGMVTSSPASSSTRGDSTRW